MAVGKDVDHSGQGFHDRLNALFDQYVHSDGRRYTNAEITEKINTSATGVTVTEAYLSMLRHGKRPEPRLGVAKAIASAFGAPQTYFLEDDAEPVGLPNEDDVEAQLRALVADNPAVAEQVDLLLTLRKAGVRNFRARGTMSDDHGLQSLIRLISAAVALSPKEREAVVQVAEVMAETPSGQIRDGQGGVARAAGGEGL
jgi:transcriptional regulator with XRE-family HTH domain